MKIRNFMRNPVVVSLSDGTKKRFPSEGVARVGIYSLSCGETIGGGVPISRLWYREVVELPRPEEGTMFIVSPVVALALGGTRSDLLVPPVLAPDEGMAVDDRIIDALPLQFW